MKVNNLKQWHKVVCSSEQYACRVCKKDFNHDHYFNEDGVNAYVCGHHFPHTQKARPDLVLETDNGVCICFDCHTKAHKGLVKIPDKETNPIRGANPRKIYIDEPSNHILPNGQKVWIRSDQKLCKKCKKYVAGNSGLCLRCEKYIPPNFKSPKKEENAKNKKRV